MRKFRKGQRVVVARHPPHLSVKLRIGLTGVVVGFNPDDNYVNVKWDEEPESHTGDKIGWHVERFNHVEMGVVAMEDTRDYLAIISNEQPL